MTTLCVAIRASLHFPLTRIPSRITRSIQRILLAVPDHRVHETPVVLACVDGVTHLAERRDGAGIQCAGLGGDHVWQVLMMEPRLGDDLPGVHAVHEAEYAFQHHGDDARTARRAD